MTYKGNLEKMISDHKSEIEYYLPVGTEKIALNSLIGEEITLEYLNEIHCVACGKKTNKSFAQGFCYQCFQSSPMASECILHPDKCKAHLGISRDMSWSESHCLTTHVVYLAVSSHLKVGITRESQVPTRWIDQGASEAIIVAKTPNRHIAGTIEKFLMQFYSDKTSWQAMLKGTKGEYNLVDEKQKAIQHLPLELQKYAFEDDSVINLNYPIKNYPVKIKSNSFDKEALIKGTLKGIKGQYLIFEDDSVINIRKHRGYLISFIV